MFVVIGIVIILLPFFQSGNTPSTEAALVKAPPFPDQATQVASAAPLEPHAQQTELSPPIQTNVNPPQHDSESAINEQPDDTISVTHPSVVNAPIPDLVAPNKIAPNPVANANASKPDKAPDLAANDEKSPLAPPIAKAVEESAPMQVAAAEKPAPVKMIKKADKEKKKQIVHLAAAFKKATHVTKHDPLSKIQVGSLRTNLMDDNGLFDLKNPVWVIQMGSFKNKTNALKLVNQLRAKGYPAFIQKMSTAIGENTRVFVGPAIKRTSAKDLASKLEIDMHLRGIVISYKPLTL